MLYATLVRKSDLEGCVKIYNPIASVAAMFACFFAFLFASLLACLLVPSIVFVFYIMSNTPLKM